MWLGEKGRRKVLNGPTDRLQLLKCCLFNLWPLFISKDHTSSVRHLHLVFHSVIPSYVQFENNHTNQQTTSIFPLITFQGSAIWIEVWISCQKIQVLLFFCYWGHIWWGLARSERYVGGVPPRSRGSSQAPVRVLVRHRCSEWGSMGKKSSPGWLTDWLTDWLERLLHQLSGEREEEKKREKYKKKVCWCFILLKTHTVISSVNLQNLR